MNHWIDLGALSKIVVGGLAFGAGLPAVFALGLLALRLGSPALKPAAVPAAGSAGRTDGDDEIVGGSALGMVLAAACFLVVAAAIAWGIYLIVKGGHH